MERFMLRSAVHLLLIRDGQILLSRRFNTGYEDGNYSVPAGHIEGGEPIRSAMEREILEEITLVIPAESLHVTHTMHRSATDRETIDFFLVADDWAGQPKIGEPHKCDDLRWFALDSLPTNIVPYVRFAIDQVKARQTFSEFGWT